MILRPYDILVNISEADRDKLFNKRLKSPDGEYLSTLCIDLPTEFGSDPAFSQDVNIAKVLEVGSEVKNIGVGDNVIIDYLVDTTSDYIFEESWNGKKCILDTRTLYYEDTRIVPANRRTHVNTFVYKKGEMIDFSKVIAVIKGLTVIPNDPYIFLEHQKEREEVALKGITYVEANKSIVERKILFTFLECPFKNGLLALIDNDFIFQRKIGEHIFDVCFASDVLGLLSVNLD